jgi:tetratricopeptide (TPR) repeat protein
MLAVRYIDAEMYELALESLEKAIRIYPENKILFYFAGVSAGRTAKSRMDEAEKRRLLVLAEKYYRRALDLDAQYVEALYGLSVLYVFEMDKVMEAEPLLNRILEIRPNHYDAMFLLARVYVTTGRVEDAVELYDKIGEESGSKTMRQKARENKQQLLEGAYEF